MLAFWKPSYWFVGRQTFKGFDEEQMEAKEPEAAPAPTLAPSTAPAPPAAPVPVPSYTINDESQEIEEPLGLEDDGEDLPGAVESVIRLSDDGEALDPYKVCLNHTLPSNLSFPLCYLLALHTF